MIFIDENLTGFQIKKALNLYVKPGKISDLK